MRISFFNVFLLAASLTALALPLQTSFADVGSSAGADRTDRDADRIARLELRLLELEQRLADTEQETQEVKVLASSSSATVASSRNSGSSASSSRNDATAGIVAGNAWRNLRWTRAEQWEGVKRGVTEEKVIELLGYPPRSLDSLKPRIDKVYWYETSLRDVTSGMSGKISFKKGRVVSVELPDFSRMSIPQQSQLDSRQRLP